MELTKISEAEKEIMSIIWASGGPVTSHDILEQLPPEREVKVTTVLTFLTRLAAKGLVSVTKKGKQNYYTPLVTEEEYKRFESKSFLRAIHGGSLKSFVAALCDDDEISPEEIEELKRWLADRRPE